MALPLAGLGCCLAASGCEEGRRPGAGTVTVGAAGQRLVVLTAACQPVRRAHQRTALDQEGRQLGRLVVVVGRVAAVFC